MSKRLPFREIKPGVKLGKLTVIKPTDKYLDYKGKQYPYYQYWLCQCECGNETEVILSNLNGKRHTKSCGCLNKEYYAPLRKMKGEAAKKSVYAKHKVYCRYRKIDSDLSFEEFWQLSEQNCKYCGCGPDKELSAVSKKGKPILNGGCIFNGLDRIDNDKAYILSNIVPACKFCNFAKHANTIEIFINKVKLIYENLQLDKNLPEDVIKRIKSEVENQVKTASLINPEDRVVVPLYIDV